jgi:hypothetical protein
MRARDNDAAVPAVMQRENERTRLTVDGKRTDDNTRCTLIVINEIGKTWALYPHGAAQLGVRISDGDAAELARAILAGGTG